MSHNKTKGGGPHNFRGGSHYHAQKAANRKITAENLEEWRKLTPTQQLKDLDIRLGKNIGAKKQRARLQKALAQANA